MQRRGGLARRTVSFGRESGRQFTGFGRETKTIPPSGGVLQAQVHCNRTLHLGNVNVPPSRPAIEGSEDGGGRRAASGRKKGPSTTSSAPRALPGRKEPGQGVVASHGRAEEPIISPRGLGTRRCARLQPRLAAARESTAVNSVSDSAAGRDTRGVQLRRIFILRGRLPILRCRDRHLILYRRAE